MLNLFITFNGMVLKSSVFLSMVVLGVFFINLAQIILVVMSVTFLITLFTSAPIIPTGKRTLKKMFEFADIQPGEKVYDLGCGEGRFLFEAERRGASAVGVELNIIVYFIALLNKKRVGSRCVIQRGNLHQVDLEDADVVFCYLMPWAMKKLAPKFRKELKKGCRIVSHGFKLPGWEISGQYIDEKKRHHPVFLYVV